MQCQEPREYAEAERGRQKQEWRAALPQPESSVIRPRLLVGVALMREFLRELDR
jgi:hypothetical protein